eukprot:16448628-Heterocapsa_arctica.AAC.1
MPLTSFLITEYDEEKEEMRFLPFVNQLLRKRGVVRPFSRLPPPEDTPICLCGQRTTSIS